MSGLPARLDHWASTLRNREPVQHPYGDVVLGDDEALELSMLCVEAANRIKTVDKAYEQGYADGQSSVAADWTAALDGLVPENVEPVPTQVAAFLEGR